MHPKLRLQKLHQFNTDNGIKTIAYFPLGRGKIWNNPILIEIAEKNKMSVVNKYAWFILCNVERFRFLKPVQKNTYITNFESQNMKISKDDMLKIETIPEKRILNMPLIGPKWDKDD